MVARILLRSFNVLILFMVFMDLKWLRKEGIPSLRHSHLLHIYASNLSLMRKFRDSI